MLHGYTQSGCFFQQKLRRLQRCLETSFPGTTFSFPTGPIKLDRAISQHQDPESHAVAFGSQDDANDVDDNDLDAYAWFHPYSHERPPVGFYASLDLLANILRTEGPFDGVIGFSQGSIMAGCIASLLEGAPRIRAFEIARSRSASAMSYPRSFLDLDHPPMKFGVTYGGMMGEGEYCAGFYENPRISTPFCHFVGSWDPIVDRRMTQMLIRVIGGDGPPYVVIHPGAHYVPTASRYLDALLSFVVFTAGEEEEGSQGSLSSSGQSSFVMTEAVEEELMNYL